jgi:acetyltransferase-like isoleucine patch superfamily enzyme
MDNKLYQTGNSQSLFVYYTKYVGNLLGGTQWLIIVLRQFGAHIGNDVIIDDMNSLYDVHLITIGSHTRLSSTCQIQV